MVFNRPRLTEVVFSAIAKVQPRQLLIVADGPREDVPDDADKCARVRAIVERIDWPCEVLRNYSETNLGCKRRISTGLDWVFETVEEAIILEDDCLPDPAFFSFCEQLLDRYRYDERVLMISGDNFQFGRKVTSYSYYFSRYTHIWGWASWGRAWEHYDVEMGLWPLLRGTGWLVDALGDTEEARYWENIFERTHKGLVNTWDYQWVFACWSQNGLSIMPAVNLVSNIGFGRDAVHTTGSDSPMSNLPVEELRFPLQHPPYVVPSVAADRFTFASVLTPRRGPIGALVRRIGLGTGMYSRLVRLLRRVSQRFREFSSHNLSAE